MYSKKIVSLIVTAAMVLSLLPQIFVNAGSEVKYLAYDPETEAYEELSCVSYSTVSGSTEDAVLSGGWYVVNGNALFGKSLTIDGDVKLILKNGCKLTVKNSINVTQSNSLTVYAQSEDYGVAGSIVADAPQTDFAAIGGTETEDCGTIVIHGGNISASASIDGAGIGGGIRHSCGNIIIYGGNISATGGMDGAGIGGGFYGFGGTVTIHGGKIRAVGRSNAAGIGCAEGGGNISVTVIGGDIYAKSGDSSNAIATGGEGTGAYVPPSTKLYDTDKDCHVTPEFLSEGDEFRFIAYNGDSNVFYSYYDEEENRRAYGFLDEYVKLTNSYTELADGWYVVDKSISLTSLGINGNVNILIEDNCTLTVNEGIRAESGNCLGIYTQTFAGSTAGKLVAHGAASSAGIGGGYKGDAGKIVIHGGNIYAVGGTDAAGIGGGSSGKGGEILLYGGKLIAEGGSEDVRAVGAGRNGSGNGSINCCDGYYFRNSMALKDFDESDTELADALDMHNVALEVIKDGSFEYISYDFTNRRPLLDIVDGYTLVTASTTELKSGWYVASGEITVESLITVSGDVKLILADNCVLTAVRGIGLTQGNSLTVYAQSDCIDSAGTLKAFGEPKRAGIGCGELGYTGSLTVCGGNIEAIGGDLGAGIGGGYNAYSVGSFTVCGGYVSAIGGVQAAGIGGGCSVGGAPVTVYGGTVSAQGGYKGDAIGHGDFAYDKGSFTVAPGVRIYDHISGYNLSAGDNCLDVLTGSTVLFTAAADNSLAPYLSYDAACDGYVLNHSGESKLIYNGIGLMESGWYVVYGTTVCNNNFSVTGDAKLILADGCNFNITGSLIINEGASLTLYPQSSDTETAGKLTVRGAVTGYGAIIDLGSLTVHGGTVDAEGASYGAGIGGSMSFGDECGSLTLYGGEIIATGGRGAAGIGGGYQGNGAKFTVYGGKVTATGTAYMNSVPRGIGAGMNYTDNGTLTIRKGMKVTDNISGEVKKQGFALTDWLDIFDGETVSFTVERSDALPAVEYLVYDGESGEFETAECEDYAVLDKSSRRLAGGWYLLDESGTTEDISILGDVHLILSDNCTLNASAIRITAGTSLTVYAQSAGENTGRIVADSSAVKFGSGIGSGSGTDAGKLTIHGGDITGIGGENSAGIGTGSYDIKTGKNGKGIDLTVYGGKITGVGGKYGAGIGGGVLGEGGSITVYGGTVVAVGGSEGGAGIGGGRYAVKYDAANEIISECGTAGTITVYGGTVEADGGYNAAGIGGGYGCDSGTVIIYDGSVTASSGSDYTDGIGCGWFDYESEHIPVEGGTVEIYSYDVYSNGEKVTPIHVHTLVEYTKKDATCTENGYSETYYHCEEGEHSCGKYYSDADAQNEISAEDAAEFFLPMLGHSFTSGEYVDNGDGTHSEKCVRCDEAADEAFAHADENVDGYCDVCKTNICEHSHSTVSYEWNENHSSCTAHKICDLCELELASETSLRVSLYEDKAGENCSVKGKGHYEAEFKEFETAKTDSVFDTGYGKHADGDNDGFCDTCRCIMISYLNVTSGMDKLPDFFSWVVKDEVTLENALTVDGDVRLYLMDGAVLTAGKGIIVTEGNSLTVYAQSSGDAAGKIVASGQRGAAGIGGTFAENDAGDVTIYSGIVIADGGLGAAGIGGGFGGDSGTVTINGGSVTASGSSGAAGIGGGFDGDCEKFVMNGGSVTATAGVGAIAGQDGSGIGGGYNGSFGEITINDLTKLTAKGGRAMGSGLGAAQSASGIKVASSLIITSNETEIDKIDGETEVIIFPDNRYDKISLTIDSDIYINFYMLLSEDAAENGKMVFAVGGRTIEGKLRTNEKNGRYYFACPVNVLEMNETVTATFTFGEKTYIKEYSVSRYIDYILGHDYSDEMKMLARKIANYGHYAQLYLESIHSNVTIGDGGYAAMYGVFGENGEYDINVAAAKAAVTDTFSAPHFVNGVSLKSRTVYFDSAIALNYYVRTEDGKAPTAVCSEGKAVTVTHNKDNIYIVSIKDISATELAKDFTVVVNGNEIKGCVLDYCGAVINKNGQTEKAVNAMAAFYEYHKAAVKYAASK